MTAKQVQLLSEVIKAEMDYRRWRVNGKWHTIPNRYVEVGLVAGSIKTARSLVESGLCDWEPSNIDGQKFIKLHDSLTGSLTE